MSGDQRAIVAFDKDSTLADTSHRHWIARKVVDEVPGYTWADYSRACTDDKPIEAARAMMYALAPTHDLYVMSGATDCPEARRWLLDHRFPYSHVLFRPPDDVHTENGMLKARWIRELQDKGRTVLFFVDDHPETAATIEQMTGVPCLRVRPPERDADMSGLIL